MLSCKERKTSGQESKPVLVVPYFKQAYAQGWVLQYLPPGLGHVNNWTERFVLLGHNAETSERLYKLL